MELVQKFQKILDNDSYLRYYDLKLNTKGNTISVDGHVSLYHHKQILNHLLFIFSQENSNFEFENNVIVKSDFTG